MPFEPMLATNRISRPLAGEWVLEPKFDGWRAIVAVDQEVRVWTRTGHELTERLPELAPLVDCCGGASVVLDGELVAGHGRAADFYGLLPRVAARRRSERLTFVAFDVLAFDGPMIDQPYCRRRALLERLAASRIQETLRSVASSVASPGSRFDAIELSIVVPFIIETDDRAGMAEGIAAGLPPANGEVATAARVLESPYVLLGTLDEMATTIEARRERWGISYYAFNADSVDSAPLSSSASQVSDRRGGAIQCVDRSRTPLSRRSRIPQVRRTLG